jgi:thiamine biosynthesis lipoprotein
MQTVRLAAMAMATRFELVVRGEEDPVWLRAAGEEALAEIHRLHDRLSFYSPTSDVARINRLAFREPVVVSIELFRLLSACRRLHTATLGAFDVTVGPLMRSWGFVSGKGAEPSETDLQAALSRVGTKHLRLDERDRTVRFDVEGAEIDLGGVGKGFAIDEAVRVLEDVGVKHAFLHGGTSSIRAMGDSPDGPHWTVAISAAAAETADAAHEDVIAVPIMANSALGVSDVRGKGFRTDAGFVGHVLDPRTGRPVRSVGLAAVEAGSAMEADALATALLILSREERRKIRESIPGLRFLVASGEAGASPTVEHSDFPLP